MPIPFPPTSDGAARLVHFDTGEAAAVGVQLSCANVRRRFLAAVGAVLIASSVLLATRGPAAAAQAFRTTLTGYDISYPQCGSAYPTSVSFGIVGVNDGIVYSANPCVASELSWAEAAGNHAPAFYANTADPGPAYSSHWPTGQQSPQVCDGSNSVACSYDYGWDAAQDSFTDAIDAETADGSASPAAAAAAAPWWLDVETSNSWEMLESAYGATATSDANDQAALRGEIALLSSKGVASVGAYSTRAQWKSITGGTGSIFASARAWIAGYRSWSSAKSGCSSTSFTGGRVALTQYPAAAFDADYSCPTPPIGKELAELKSFDAAAGDEFGNSVAISGTTAIVGATGYGKNAGRAYVFTNAAGVWKEAAVLKGSDTVAGDDFGSSVAISGTTAIVGANNKANLAGRAYVFTETKGAWTQTAELKGSDTVAGEDFGISVAISDVTAIVGASGYTDHGRRAYVFTKTAGVWTQAAELKASDTTVGDGFGRSVAISGATAVVGAPYHARKTGRAYVFAETAGIWKQAAELKGSATFAVDVFGYGVAVSGTTVVVGAYLDADGGRAYVFTKTAGIWKQAGELKGSDTVAGDDFGFGVAMSGTTALVGGDVSLVGRTYVFTKTAGIWKQTAELKGSDTVAGDDFGLRVAISGITAVVGAFGRAKSAGRAYVFEA